MLQWVHAIAHWRVLSWQASGPLPRTAAAHCCRALRPFRTPLQPPSPLLQHQEVQCECKTADGVFVELVVSGGLCTADPLPLLYQVGKWIGRHAGLPVQAAAPILACTHTAAHDAALPRGAGMLFLACMPASADLRIFQ